MQYWCPCMLTTAADTAVVLLLHMRAGAGSHRQWPCMLTTAAFLHSARHPEGTLLLAPPECLCPRMSRRVTCWAGT
jgi:hypothetical protein